MPDLPLPDAPSAAPPAGSPQARAVRRVLVVHKTHLDVGFTAPAHEVRRRYLEVHLPTAVATAQALESRGGPERLRWTTGSWVLTEALDAEGPDGPVAAAVRAGHLAWHAMPFTTHTEYAGRELLGTGLQMSHRLDRRFGRTTRGAKLTDVPGHTRALVGLLARHGVGFLHLGMNPAWPTPDVPVVFNWVDPADPASPSVVVMYQPGGYGDVQLLGPDVAVAMVVSGDNVGAPSPQEVVDQWAVLSARFPNAVVRAADLNDVAEAAAKVRDQLPTVTSELGDAWLHGVAADPEKTARFLLLRRLRERWLADRNATVDELDAMGRALLMVAEHTWGQDHKTFWPTEHGWDPDSLAALRHTGASATLEASWHEQRALVDAAVDTLATTRPDLADQARVELAGLWAATRSPVRARPPATPAGTAPARPSASLAAVVPGDGVTLGPWSARLGPDGSLDLGDAGQVGALVHRAWSADELEQWFAHSCPDVAEHDMWWARWDNLHPGLEHTAASGRTAVPTVAAATLVADDDDGAELRVELSFSGDDVTATGAPRRATVLYRHDHRHPGTLDATLWWSDRPASRWPSSTWWQWAPAVSSPWTMVKLGEDVAPSELVARGGVLHCVDELRAGPLTMSALDAQLVMPVPEGPAASLVPGTVGTPPAPHRWRWWLADTRWGTNFPMWVEGPAMFRVRLVGPAR